MKTAIRIPPVSPLDMVGMERWLEQMAAKGLFLRRYRDSFCIFTKGEPKRLRYRLEANPRNLLEDEAPKDKTELYRSLGWDYCCEVPYSFLVFSSGDPDAPELYTDPTLQQEQVTLLLRRKRTSLLWNLFFLVLLIGLTAFLLIRYPPETFHDFARSSFLLILILLLAVMLLADGAALRWLRRLTEHLSQSFPEPLPEPSPSARLLQRLRGYISAAVMLSVVLNSLISLFLGAPGGAWVLLLLVPLLFLSIWNPS